MFCHKYRHFFWPGSNSVALSSTLTCPETRQRCLKHRIQAGGNTKRLMKARLWCMEAGSKGTFGLNVQRRACGGESGNSKVAASVSVDGGLSLCVGPEMNRWLVPGWTPPSTRDSRDRFKPPPPTLSAGRRWMDWNWTRLHPPLPSTLSLNEQSCRAHVSLLLVYFVMQQTFITSHSCRGTTRDGRKWASNVHTKSPDLDSDPLGPSVSSIVHLFCHIFLLR